MKKFYKIFTVAFALTLTFVLAGCGKPTPPPADLTTAQIAGLLTNLINFDDLNFTATADANYAVSMKQGTSPRQGISDEIEDIVLKVDGNKAYISIPNLIENYEYENWSIEKNFDDSNYEIYFHNQESNIFELISEVSPEIGAIVQEMFGNVVNFEPSWLSSSKLSSGAYKLVLNADLKPGVVALQHVLVDFADSTLEELLDAVLQIHYGENFSLGAVIENLKEKIDSDSTLEDVLNFVSDDFGISLTATYQAARNIIQAIDDESGMPELDANFFDLIDIEDNEEFESFIDAFVESFLQDDERTLNAIMADEDDDFGQTLKQIYDVITEVTINELSVSASFITNTANTKIVSVSLSVVADVTMEDMNLKANAGVNIEFSKFGTTEIILPAFTRENVVYVDLYYHFYNEELTADTPIVIENVNLGAMTFDWVTYETGDDAVIPAYDPVNHTLTIPAACVNYMLTNGTIHFEDLDNGEYYLVLAYHNII